MTNTTDYKKDNALKNAARRRRRLGKQTGLDWIDPAPGGNMVRGEQALWRAVILQMLEDAVSQSNKAQDKFDREQARIWLQGNHKDFYMVCDLAGYEITYVKRQVKKALSNNCRWRNDKKSRPVKSLEVNTPHTESMPSANPSCDILPLHLFYKKSA